MIVDEAHERNVSTDLLLGSLKRIQKVRNSKKPDANGDLPNPLKVIIMSATLDAERFSEFFNKAPILYVRGRQHTVKIYNSLSMPEDYQEAAVRTFFQIHHDQPAGDVLIFLTGTCHSSRERACPVEASPDTLHLLSAMQVKTTLTVSISRSRLSPPSSVRVSFR